MASPVSRLPAPDNGDGVPPADVYRIAVDEYRFQATFNWSRTQYLLGLNVAIFVAGTVVAAKPGHGAMLVFTVGAGAAALTVLVLRTQHGYYRAARDHLRAVEERFGVDERLDTTSTMGGRRRAVSVNQLVYLLLALLILSNLGGVVIVAAR